MKSRKTRTLVALGLAAISGFLLIGISIAEKDIKLDPTNAKQIIPTIFIRSSVGDSTKQVELGNVGKMIRIDTKEYNFILSDDTSTAGGKYSAILGGKQNHIDGNTSNNSVIIAGENNQINDSSYAVIAGGMGNHVEGNFGTVAGGQGNTTNAYSTVVGGRGNTANGDYSVALGNNTKAIGSTSVAMGSGATVNGSNSFLWNDGTSNQALGASDTFAVVGGSGVVVNKTKAHRFAQLTIGGSLLVNEGTRDDSVVCGPSNPSAKGVLKVVKNDVATNQVCFCSCDGKNRTSLFGAGNCSKICGATAAPKCGTHYPILTKKCDETKNPKQFIYSGTCDVGEVVEGNGAYMIDNEGKVHWTCQTNDGAWTGCSRSVDVIEAGSCSEPAPLGKCSGNYDSSCTKFLDGSDSGFNGIVNATLYANHAAAVGHKCAWYCDESIGCYQKGDTCVKGLGCQADIVDDYEVPYLEHGASTGVTKTVAGQTCTNTATCDDTHITLGVDNCEYNVCKGSYPDGATPSTKLPSNNTTNWFCATDITQACSYKCQNGMKCNSSNNGCIEKENGECDTAKYKCKKGNPINTGNNSTEFTWNCKGADDTGNGDSCTLPCPSGQVIRNGACVDNVRVKFKVNNNSVNDSIDVFEVMLFNGGRDTTVIEFENINGSYTTVAANGSVTSDYSSYNFAEGVTYRLKLVYDRDGNCHGNQTTCEFLEGEFTPYAGENTFVFNVPDRSPMYHDYTIYWSSTLRPEDSLLTYVLKVWNSDNNRYENMPINVGLTSHYTINARPGGVPASNEVYPLVLNENGGTNGNYELTVNIYSNATNGISNIHLTNTDGAISWEEVRGSNIYRIKLTKDDTQGGVCGDAARGAFSERPTSELCALGTASSISNVSTYGGNDDGWSWTCTNDGISTPCTACNLYKTVYDRDHHEVTLTMEYSTTYNACVAYKYNGTNAIDWGSCQNPGGFAGYGTLGCRTDWVRFRNGLMCDTFMSSADWVSRSNSQCGLGGGAFDQATCGCVDEDGRSCSALLVCPETPDGGTCTSYNKCSTTKITSTCNNGVWDKTPGAYSAPSQDCDNSCSGCPSGTVSHGGTCTSYNKCSTTKITSTCNNGVWDKTPGSYSGPSQGCNSCYSSACGTKTSGQTCTSYNRCSSTAITSTCNNGTWSTTPGDYSGANQGCNSCSGCPSGTVLHGGTCTSYNKCNTTKITSTCTDGSWNNTPGSYSGPSQGCDNSCYSSACGTKTSGQTCTSYNRCSSTAITSTCNNGTWSTTPGDYSGANQGCNSCSGCPSGTVLHGGTCTSYNKCNTTKITSTCTDGSWNNTPGAYSGPNQGCNSCSGCPSGTVLHGGTCTSYNKCSTTKITSTCNNGSWNTTPGAYGSASQDCSCLGSYPDGVTTSTVSPTNNTTNWFCAENTTQACSYKCPLGFKCNSSNNGCIELENGDCSTVKYKCNVGDPINTGYNSTEFTWNCKGADDIGNGASCTAPLDVDGVCGDNYTPVNKRCLAGEMSGYNSTTKSWKCLGQGSGQSVSCTYSCTTTTVGGSYTCPRGYELNAAGDTCNFVGFKYCATKLCTCSSGLPCACMYGEYGDELGKQGCASYTCFGDESQKAGKGTDALCEWPQLELVQGVTYNGYEFTANSFGNIYGLTKYRDKTEDVQCHEVFDESNCTELVHYTVSRYDNGYYVKSCGSSVPSTMTPCGDPGTTTTTCSVRQITTCFPAGTKVIMADGSKKNIENINAGDVVLTYNTETKSIEPNYASPIVHENSTDEMYELTINGNILKVTYAHRFYVVTPRDDNYQCGLSYDWVAAEDLMVGDMLFMVDGSYVVVDKIEHHDNVETVYNLSVDGNHNYFVEDGYLVHNRKLVDPILVDP